MYMKIHILAQLSQSFVDMLMQFFFLLKGCRREVSDFVGTLD